jgi:hypothetical protein
MWLQGGLQGRRWRELLRMCEGMGKGVEFGGGGGGGVLGV